MSSYFFLNALRNKPLSILTYNPFSTLSTPPPLQSFWHDQFLYFIIHSSLEWRFIPTFQHVLISTTWRRDISSQKTFTWLNLPSRCPKCTTMNEFDSVVEGRFMSSCVSAESICYQRRSNAVVIAERDDWPVNQLISVRRIWTSRTIWSTFLYCTSNLNLDNPGWRILILHKLDTHQLFSYRVGSKTFETILAKKISL